MCLRLNKITLGFILLVTGFLPSLSNAQTLSITPNEVLFKVHPLATRPAERLDQIEGIREVRLLLPLTAGTKPTVALSGHYVADLDPGQSVTSVIARLQQRADILYAQPNHLFQTFQVTNDPLLDDQFHLDQIKWPTLYASLPDKQKNVIVAIIDSGIDYTHEDLVDSMWRNEAEANGRSGVDDDQNGYVDDVYGWDFTDAPNLPGQGDYLTPDSDPMDESSHGTQVAGVVGATQNNGIGISGVADCRLMAVRAGLTFDQGGTFLQEDDLAAGIIYAVDNGADILNLSWGSFDRAYVIEDAVRYATDRGVIVVAAAGNSSGPPVAYPAALEHVISVSAIETTGQLAAFSSFGPVLDVVAPGVNIVSTRLNNGYGPRSGSSFAAPQVSGLAALILSRQPQLDTDRLRGALVASVTDLGTQGWDSSFGAGQADASQLVDFVSGTEPVSARILSPLSDQEISETLSVSALTSGQGATGYRLSWSTDTTPPSWTLIDSGSPADTLSTIWTPANLTNQRVILRLEVDSATELLPIEHRVRLLVNPSVPTLSSLFYGPILVGDRIEWGVRWITQEATSGKLVLISDSGFTRDTLSTSKVDRFHEVVLPDQDVAVSFEFQIIAESPSGLTLVTDPEPISISPARVPSIGFSQIAALPDGFLADGVTDFDGNGKPEITLMPYVEGQAFSQSQVYAFEQGAFSSVHTTDSQLLPWNVADVNHDGSPDLLGTSVARIQLLTGSPYPSVELFDQSGVWGGSMADADGDGANEIIARSLTDHTIRLYRFDNESGAFSEFAALVDFSPGVGEIGPRFVMGDLDGDFRQELLAGDGDGDIWIYETNGGVMSSSFLLEGPDNTDARVVGGGQDLDGDGNIEFAVARANPDDTDPLNGWWDLEIYQATGNNQFALEWGQRISGVATPGNGIATGDLDGDGLPELVVALIPDLYVLSADGPNTYRPIYHEEISLTYRPLISDLDNDGSAEVIFNAGGEIRIMERTEAEDIAQRPEILKALSLGPSQVQITWMASPDAVSYRLLRRSGAGEQVVTESPALSYIDEDVSAGDSITYRVVAIRQDNTEITSGPRSVTPQANPSVTRIDRIDENRIAVLYSRSMSDTATEPNGYRLHPLGEVPTSAIRDQGSHRIILSFTGAVLESVTHTLEIRLATDLAGALIDPAFRSVTFALGSNAQAARVDFDSNGVVGFGDFLLFAAAFGSQDPAFDLDDDNLVGFSDFLIFAGLFGQAA